MAAKPKPIWILSVTAFFWLTGCATYVVQRAALVGPPTPPLWSGKNQPTGFTAGNSTVVWNSSPERSRSSDSGLYVSSTQMDGRINLSLNESSTISAWLPLSYGFSQGSFAAAPCLVERPSDGVLTLGLGFGVGSRLSDSWYFGIALEALLASIPSRILARCESFCSGQLVEKEETDEIGILRGTLVFGADLGAVRLFGGFSVRNHPSNVRIRTETVLSDSDIHADVESGPWYGVLGAGIEVDISRNFSCIAQVFQPFPLQDHDLVYGPILGVSVDVHLPQKNGNK